MKFESLNRNGDFVRLYKKGKNVVRPEVVLYWMKSRRGRLRVGITASKKVGGAVTRNRAKRVIRHALYEVLPPDAGAYDLVFVARGRTAGLKSTELAKTLARILQQEGILPPAAGKH